MKRLALTLAAFGAIAVLASPAMAGGPWSQCGPSYGYSSYGYAHSALHNDLNYRAYQREAIHYNAHQYPMSYYQHQQLHNALDHDAFHDYLDHRSFHSSSRFASPGYYGGYGSGISFGSFGRGGGISFRIGF